MRRASMLGWTAPALVVYLAFLVAPYGVLLRLSVFRYDAMRLYVAELTAANYVALLTDPFYLALIGRTVALGAVVTLATLALGYPLAMRIARSGPRAKTLLLAVTLSPLLVNLVVRSYAWLVLLGDHGLINRMLAALGLATLPLTGNAFAVAVGLVHVALPLMVLSLVGVIERIDATLAEAAASLGAGAGRIAWRVTLPLSLPGAAAGSLLVFCLTVSAFVTPAVLGGNRVATVSTVIYDKFIASVNWPMGATLVMALLAITLLVAVLHGRVAAVLHGRIAAVLHGRIAAVLHGRARA